MFMAGASSGMRKLLPGFGLALVLLHPAMEWYSPAFADDSVRVYTLSQLVERALSAYGPLSAGQHRIKEQKALVEHEKRWNNPSIGLELGRKSVDGATGNLYGLSITQNIHFPGKRGLLAEIARFEENKAKLGLEEMRLFIRYEVARLAYEYAQAWERTGHIRDRLERLRLINSYMKGRVLVSPQKIVEKEIITLRIAGLEKELHKIRSDLKAAYARLDLYAGLDEKEPPEIRIDWFSKAPALSLDSLIAGAAGNGFAVRMQREAVRAAGNEAALARREPYPDIGISLFFQQDRVDTTERTFGGGVSFPIPIISQNRHAVDRFREKEEAERRMEEHVARLLTQKVRELYAHYELAGKMVERFSMARVPELEKSMRYADSEFRKGRVTLVTYLEMDTQIHETLEMMYSSQIDLVNLYTSLLFLAAEEREVRGR